ncbi:hypothetical protein LCGC14_0437010 [marine sediment metagenome]|uniref:Uncharacterized protein n=1 Tax=marine sediment metagenome TaxID=412755 RepID=A0A0F9T4V5_9ZZZZ
MSVATTAPLWGHESREAVAARLFDHIDALLSGPELRGFPEGLPRLCRAYAARVRKARELLTAEVVLSASDHSHHTLRLLTIESKARAGGWL